MHHAQRPCRRRLRRFERPTAFESSELGYFGQISKSPRPPSTARPPQGPVRRRAHRGRKHWGSGGCRPPAVERLRRGRDAGGRQQAVGRHCLCPTPQRGVCYLVFCHWLCPVTEHAPTLNFENVHVTRYDGGVKSDEARRPKPPLRRSFRRMVECIHWAICPEV
jgi:hypothetical protein